MPAELSPTCYKARRALHGHGVEKTELIRYLVEAEAHLSHLVIRGFVGTSSADHAPGEYENALLLARVDVAATRARLNEITR